MKRGLEREAARITDDTVAGLGQLILLRRQADANVATGRGAEGFAWHGHDILLIEEPQGEIIAGKPRSPDICHDEHAALRHANRNPGGIVQAVDKQAGAADIGVAHGMTFLEIATERIGRGILEKGLGAEEHGFGQGEHGPAE